MELPMYTELLLELVELNKKLDDRGTLALTYNAKESRFVITANLDDGTLLITDKYLTTTILGTKRELIFKGYLPETEMDDMLCTLSEAVRYCPELGSYYYKLKGF